MPAAGEGAREATLAALADFVGRRIDPPGRAGDEDPTVGELGNLMLWPGLEGEINSSGDWALVREDGLLVLESRFTIKPAVEEGAFISVTMTGAGDLRRVFGGGLSGQEAYERWTRSAPDDELPITASLHFESPGPARNDGLVPARRYGSGSRNHWRYVRLRRGTFVGRGVITVDRQHRRPRWTSSGS